MYIYIKYIFMHKDIMLHNRKLLFVGITRVSCMLCSETIVGLMKVIGLLLFQTLCLLLFWGLVESYTKWYSGTIPVYVLRNEL